MSLDQSLKCLIKPGFSLHDKTLHVPWKIVYIYIYINAGFLEIEKTVQSAPAVA